MSRAGRLGGAEDWGLIPMGSTPSYRKDTRLRHGRQSTQTLTNTIRRAVSCRNLLAILQNDQNFTRADEAKLTPGNCFEGGGIFLQATDLVAKGGIFTFELVEAVRSRAEILSGPNRPGEATLAEQAIQQQDTAEKDDRPPNPASLTTPSVEYRRGIAFILRRCVADQANGKYQRTIKSTSEKLWGIADCRLLNAD